MPADTKYSILQLFESKLYCSKLGFKGNQVEATLVSGQELSVASTWLPLKPSLLQDRKSTRLNSSHDQISYAVFCLKKKKSWRQDCRVGSLTCGACKGAPKSVPRSRSRLRARGVTRSRG